MYSRYLHTIALTMSFRHVAREHHLKHLDSGVRLLRGMSCSDFTIGTNMSTPTETYWANFVNQDLKFSYCHRPWRKH